MGRAGAATLAGHCRVMCSAAQVVCLMSGFARIARRPPPFIFLSTPQDNPMPVISVTLLSGYAADVQARVAGRLAHAVRSVVPASDAGTTVYIHEASTYQRDGHVLQAGAPALPEDTQRWCVIFCRPWGSATWPLPRSAWRRGSRWCFRATGACANWRNWAPGPPRVTATCKRTTNALTNPGKAVTRWFFAVARFLATGPMAVRLLACASSTVSRSKAEKIRLQEVWNDLGEHR